MDWCSTACTVPSKAPNNPQLVPAMSTANDRAFKLADLISLIYRYVPPDLHIQIDESHLQCFETALTHRSACRASSYERMEFLGDSIGTAILTSYIFRRFPNEDEGFLTRLRAYLISGKVYADVSRQIGLASWVRLGVKHEHLRTHSNTHEDVYEAFIGAMYLAFGYPVTEIWVVRSFEEYTDISEMIRRVVNPRERLTNFCLAMHGAKPRVETSTVEQSGGTDVKFAARVYHPTTGMLISEGHAPSTTKATGKACEAAMEIILSQSRVAPSHRGDESRPGV